jgi:hypothetical protein
VIMFGLTALRCHSLEDKYNPLLRDTDYGNTSSGNPSVNDTIPARADIPASNAPDGEVVPRHLDEPLYPIFNWNDALNPASLIVVGEVGDIISYSRWDVFSNGPALPQVVNGVHFKDPKKSPLDYNGQNYITILLQPGAQAPEIQMIDVIFCEFYDRKTTEGLQQSWNYYSSPNQTIIGNDKPLYFGSSTLSPSGSLSTNAGFDLTKGAENSADDCLLSGLDDVLSTSLGPLVGLTAAQQAVITAYGAECAVIINAFNASQGPIITAAINALAVAENTQANIGVYINAYNIGTFSKTSVTPTTFNVTPFFDHGTSALTGDDFIDMHIAMGDEPGIWIVEQSQAQFWNTIQSGDDLQTTVVEEKTTAYEAAITATPNLPPVPPDGGSDIDDCIWRAVTVAGDDWTFGPWRNE